MRCNTAPALLLALLMGAPALAVEQPLQPRRIYGLIGELQLDAGPLTFEGADGSVYSGRYDDLPYGGAAVQTPFPGSRWFGWEAGGAVSWKSDTTAFAASNTSVRVRIDSDLFVLETSLGAYAQATLGRLRLYAAAGPVLLLGLHDVDDEAESEHGEGVAAANSGSFIRLEGDDSDATLGGYGRVGVELRVSPETFIGVSAKYLNADLQFDTFRDELDLTGTHWLLTVGGYY